MHTLWNTYMPMIDRIMKCEKAGQQKTKKKKLETLEKRQSKMNERKAKEAKINTRTLRWSVHTHLKISCNKRTTQAVNKHTKTEEKNNRNGLKRMRKPIRKLVIFCYLNESVLKINTYQICVYIIIIFFLEKKTFSSTTSSCCVVILFIFLYQWVHTRFSANPLKRKTHVSYLFCFLFFIFHFFFFCFYWIPFTFRLCVDSPFLRSDEYDFCFVNCAMKRDNKQ